jgi:hypothetical protein
MGGQAQLAAAAIPWLVTAALLAASAQPALLALLAAQLAFSLILLLPGAADAFGADPVTLTFGATGVEAILFALVRGGLALTAWSQFLFYRMLYGTAMASGLDPRLPAVPEVVPNRSDTFAVAGRAMGALSLLVVLASLSLRGPGAALPVLTVGHATAVYAIGLGVGSAFSPTGRRAAALTGVILGSLAFLGSVAAGRFLTP